MKTGRSILLAGVLGAAALCNQEDAAPAVDKGRIEKAESGGNPPRSHQETPNLPTRAHTVEAVAGVLDEGPQDTYSPLGRSTSLDLYRGDLENELRAYKVDFTFSGGWFVTEEFLFRVEEGGNGEALFTAQRRSFPYPMAVIRSYAATPEKLLDLVLNPETLPTNKVEDTGSF